jgi:hypothetical protein
MDWSRGSDCLLINLLPTDPPSRIKKLSYGEAKYHLHSHPPSDWVVQQARKQVLINPWFRWTSVSSNPLAKQGRQHPRVERGPPTDSTRALFWFVRSITSYTPSICTLDLSAVTMMRSWGGDLLLPLLLLLHSC